MSREFKHVDEILRPDTRSTAWARFDPQTRTMVPIDLNFFHEKIAQIELGPQVPDDIANHFDTARNLMIYSWFCYRFGVVAEFYSFISVEFALKIRLGIKPDDCVGMKKLLKMAKTKGLIKKENFSHYQELERIRQRQEEENARSKENFGFPTWAEMNNEDFLEKLLDFLPYFRNTFAHGTPSLWAGNIFQLNKCADLINQLFAEPKQPPISR